MKLRWIIAACVALTASAAPRWMTEPGTPLTVKESGFDMRATLPQGWSYSKGFVPPAKLAQTCRVSVALHTDQNWDRFLVSTLRRTGPAGPGDRAVVKIGGHPAVANRYMRDGVAVYEFYVDLSALQADSIAVWTLEQDASSDCELRYLAIVNSSTVTR